MKWQAVNLVQNKWYLGICVRDILLHLLFFGKGGGQSRKWCCSLKRTFTHLEKWRSTQFKIFCCIFSIFLESKGKVHFLPKGSLDNFQKKHPFRFLTCSWQAASWINTPICHTWGWSLSAFCVKLATERKDRHQVVYTFYTVDVLCSRNVNIIDTLGLVKQSD